MRSLGIWVALILAEVLHGMARAAWLVASRGLLWTPHTAVPGLLAGLVEAAGVDAGLHRGDPDRLRRLAALLPGWRP